MSFYELKASERGQTLGTSWKAVKANMYAASAAMHILGSSLGPCGRRRTVISDDANLLVLSSGSATAISPSQAMIVNSSSNRALKSSDSVAADLIGIEMSHPAARLIAHGSVRSQSLSHSDGTAMCALLTSTLCARAVRLISEGLHPLDIIDGYEWALGKALDLIPFVTFDSIEKHDERPISKDEFKEQVIEKAEIVPPRLLSLLSRIDLVKELTSLLHSGPPPGLSSASPLLQSELQFLADTCLNSRFLAMNDRRPLSILCAEAAQQMAHSPHTTRPAGWRNELLRNRLRFEHCLWPKHSPPSASSASSSSPFSAHFLKGISLWGPSSSSFLPSPPTPPSSFFHQTLIASNIRIALLSCPLELPKPKTRHFVNISSAQQMEELSQMRAKTLQIAADRLRSSGASVIICQWGADPELVQALMKGDIVTKLFTWIPADLLERLATSLGASICPRLEDLSPSLLGYASHFYEISDICSFSEIEKMDSERQQSLYLFQNDGKDEKQLQQQQQQMEFRPSWTVVLQSMSRLFCQEAETALRSAISACLWSMDMHDGKGRRDCKPFCGGGGTLESYLSVAIELEATKSLRIGPKRRAAEAFSRSLLAVPKYLLESCRSSNPVEDLSSLEEQHRSSSSPCYSGVFFDPILGCHVAPDVRQTSSPLVDSTSIRRSAIVLASRATCSLLRIDDMIAVSRAQAGAST